MTIVGEVVHPIEHCLIARTELQLPEIEVVVSHPQANAQCARFIRARLPQARVMAGSPWRVALIASSSWSHAFLTPKHHLLHPDVAADRAMYETLRAGDYEAWRKTPLATIEDSGQQEMLNWLCLAGAMAELGRRPAETTFVESHIFNSNKVFAFFPAT